MLRQKECHGWKTAVFTFDMAPMGVVSGKRATVITTNEERRNNMRAMGMDYLVAVSYTHLDVYKRQRIRRAASGNQGRRRAHPKAADLVLR